MNTSIDPSESDQLKKEVADLKRQLGDLRQFLSVNETDSGRKNLIVTCSASYCATRTPRTASVAA